MIFSVGIESLENNMASAVDQAAHATRQAGISYGDPTEPYEMPSSDLVVSFKRALFSRDTVAMGLVIKDIKM